MSTCIVNTNAEGLTTLTLNRPEKHNAFNAQVIQDIQETLETINSTKQTRVLLINATGQSFCAGADLDWMKASARWSEAENIDDAKTLARMLSTLNSMPIPTIAAVQGPAYGGGVGLIACCDIAIASEEAKFALTEVKLGLIPATISPYVIDAIGRRAARRFFLTGERFTSTTARELGLIHQTTRTDQLDNLAAQLIDRLLSGGPAAQHASKLLIQEIPDLAGAELIEETARRIAHTRVSDEAQEGLNAFFSKRKPDWVPKPRTAQDD